MATAATPTGLPHVTKTQFWNEIMHDVFGPRKGGAIMFLDAENARKGVAKTSSAVALARLFASAFRYELCEDDMVLGSGIKYLRRYQEHPGWEQPSVIVLDEFVGGGAGDKRRSMANQNIDFGRAWQLLRTKRVITIATLPDWNEADKRLKKLADYRIWCRERPMGTFQAYKVIVPFDSGRSGKVHTKGLGYGINTTRIKFPNMDAESDPLYQHLTEKKDELIHSNTWDADNLVDEEGNEALDPGEIQRREAIKYAIRLYEPWDPDKDTSYREVSRVLDGYSSSWVSNRVQEWRNGEHHELVPDPTEEN